MTLVFHTSRTASSASIVLDRPTPLSRSVNSSMFSRTNNHQILNSVVGLVPIDVMDEFVRRQRSSQVLFHDPTMFPEVAAIEADIDVSGWPDKTATFPSWVIGASKRSVLALLRAVSSGAARNAIRLDKELFLTAYTDSGDTSLQGCSIAGSRAVFFVLTWAERVGLTASGADSSNGHCRSLPSETIPFSSGAPKRDSVRRQVANLPKPHTQLYLGGLGAR